jgi:hypothetical protein
MSSSQVKSSTDPLLPTYFPECNLWLDGADSTTQTLSGTNVTVWKDKSGKGNDGATTGGTTTVGSINSVRALTFNATSSFEGNSITNTGTTLTAFIVATLSGGGSYARLLSCALPSETDNAGSSSVSVLNRFSNTGSVYGTRNSVNTTIFATASPFLIVVQYTGSQNAIYYNGTQQGNSANSTGNFGYTRYRVADVAGNNASSKWAGIVGEILIYNSSFTTSRRQIMEGYLAWKWGMQANLPSTHPYRFYAPSLVPPQTNAIITYPMPPAGKAPLYFDPLTISSCQMWLDSADSSSFQLSGTNILRWKDKSGRANDAVVSGVAYATLSTGPLGVYFNNSLYTTPYTADPTNETVFLVFNFTGGASQLIMIGAYSGGRSVAIYNDLATMGIIKAQVGWGPTVAYTRNRVQVATAVITSGSSQSITINAGNASTGGAVTYNSGNVTILGREAGVQLGYVGYIHEIIIYNRVLSSADQQKIQGYLAWKWGAQTFLPSSFPYKAGPPSPYAVLTLPKPISSTRFSPTKLTGLQLWLDAADASTLFIDTGATTLATLGQTIARWNDKSGNGNYVYQNTAGNRPTFTKSAVGALSLYFSTSSIQLVSISNNTTTGNASRTVFAVSYSPGTTSRSLTGTGGHAVNTPPTAFGLDNSPASSITYIWYPYVYNASDVTQLVSIKNMIVHYAYYDASVSRVGGKYSFGNDQSKSTTLNTSASVWYLGNRPDGGGSIDSYFSEFMHFNRMLTTTEVAQIEGYLAWKWGLVANLPSSHPFKLFPPPP